MRAIRESRVRAMSMTSKRIVGPVEDAPVQEGPSLWDYGQGVGNDKVMVIAGHRVPAPIAVIVISAVLVAIAALVFLACVTLLPGI